ncbi:protein of unknown function DUF328 [Magnetococcus marinus MC-1]|uniref:UPF0246 protein Mmc1_3117 n=1 Tax=Magnetococcus marinus (strain ATCC BAA-1437 / JCM 17883 / MC-1) TaxID=156889 RepID=Y3117_MAGMM|nr:peroxide stress protein YaaA [Magnetococcus marinus]A0LCB4.1 RecName: Full=UPF0246 protein Mmc1_3117 [Magnetococcus marinus MC-1]ABK45607.1 protein of unknown function DUF328 [Magnetococcus marinus MC-1]
MLAVLSPAKKLDETLHPSARLHTLPELLPHTQNLIEQLRGYDAAQLAHLMKLSPTLAELNVQRYQAFHFPFTPANAKAALFMFQGDTYVGLQAGSMDEQALLFAQQHLRILSGLYGVLRPLDLIQPYRLEMGTALVNGRGKDLYAYWGEHLVERLNAASESHGERTLINLASIEYFKGVKRAKLAGALITPIFKEVKGGEAKVIGLMAKRARGMMARYMINQRLESPEPLKTFNQGGYVYQPKLSTAEQWVFTRSAA